MSSSTKVLQVKNSDSNVVNDDGSPAPDQTQSPLRISELRYRRLFEAARDGILILDAVTLKITDVNPFMTELLGYSHAEFLGKELWEIGLFSDKDASQAAFKELQRTRYLRYEDLPLQATNGKLRDVEFVSTCMKKIVIKLYSATSATSLIESERRKNGRYSWQRHSQHA
jgi:PAS domain S-box-containing protein